PPLPPPIYMDSYLDTLFSNTKVVCLYQKYGCASSMTFHDAVHHADVCVFALYFMVGLIFKGLAGTPHVSAHSHGEFTYDNVYQYVIDALNSKGKHHEILISDEEEGVFLLDIDCPKNYHFINLVC
ncbi:hypothetical protein ZWY2020_051037, partial [Hordeum vulgare]